MYSIYCVLYIMHYVLYIICILGHWIFKLAPKCWCFKRNI